MKAAIPWLISLAALATLAVLVGGIVNMFRKDQNPRRANKLMRWRVGLQAAAVALLVLFLVFVGR
jgi:hypothetical protein